MTKAVDPVELTEEDIIAQEQAALEARKKAKWEKYREKRNTFMTELNEAKFPFRYTGETISLDVEESITFITNDIEEMVLQCAPTWVSYKVIGAPRAPGEKTPSDKRVLHKLTLDAAIPCTIRFSRKNLTPCIINIVPKDTTVQTIIDSLPRVEDVWIPYAPLVIAPSTPTLVTMDNAFVRGIETPEGVSMQLVNTQSRTSTFIVKSEHPEALIRVVSGGLMIDGSYEIRKVTFSIVTKGTPVPTELSMELQNYLPLKNLKDEDDGVDQDVTNMSAWVVQTYDPEEERKLEIQDKKKKEKGFWSKLFGC